MMRVGLPFRKRAKSGGWKVSLFILMSFLFLAASGESRALGQVPGTADPNFMPNIGGDIGGISLFAVQGDGKILIAGSFNIVNGASRNGIARLNANGTLDSTFSIGTGATGPITGMVVQPDGKIVLCGYFELFDNTPRSGVVRLNPDGTIDPTFIPPLQSSFGFRAMARQPDGKFVIADTFNILRLNANGTLDTGFNGGVRPSYREVDFITVRPDGRIILSGPFRTIGSTGSSGIIRLNPNGTVDPTFQNNVNFFQRAVSILPDGRLIALVDSITEGGQTRRDIIRLNPDGTLDPSFNANGVFPNFGSFLNRAIPQSDGSIIVLGDFSGLSVGNRNLVRLNGNGTLDPTFTLGADQNSTNTPGAFLVTPTDQILLGGDSPQSGGNPGSAWLACSPEGGLTGPLFHPVAYSSGAPSSGWSFNRMVEF